jgi:hypothetical protein
MKFGIRYIRKSSNYKYVSLISYNGVEKWQAALGASGGAKVFDTERAAALNVDKRLLEKGKKPVNILVPK